jgi:hypothetical protein
MIHEKQAMILISECEMWLDNKLTKLRTSLRSNHENTRPTLWELIVLHSIAFYLTKNSKEYDLDSRISNQIQSEPIEGCPDIFLQPTFCEPFFIEVTYMDIKNHLRSEMFFRHRIIKELKKTNTGQEFLIVAEPSDLEKNLNVPSKKHWDQIFKSEEWKHFAKDVSLGNLPVKWYLNEGNIVIKAMNRDQDFRRVQSLHPSITIKENPIYKTIQEKAAQAKNWSKASTQYEPLVLIIGASEKLSSVHGEVEKVVYSALADEQKLDSHEIVNSTYNSFGFEFRGRRKLRVSGSKLISAVVFVTFTDEFTGGLGSHLQHKASQPLIIENPHPNIALTNKQVSMLRQIDFNKVEYASGTEHWEKSKVNHQNPKSNEYIKGLRQEFSLSSNSLNFDHQSSFDIGIPCIRFIHLLAGNIDNKNFWGNSDSDLIKTLLNNAAVITHPIVNIEFLEADYRSRKSSCIKISFGPARFLLNLHNRIGNKKYPYYFEVNSFENITLSIGVEFMLDVLTRDKPIEELWRSEEQEKTCESLKKIIDNGHEIIGLSSIQNSLEPESKSHIIFVFGEANNTLIRERKEILLEEKRLKKTNKNKLP